jgi:DNA ligase (NAD+)
MNRIEELKSLITQYDTAYRKSIPMVSDEVYDNLVDELISLIGENDDFFISSVKEDEDSSERREMLPTDNSVVMASMEKIKTVEEFLKYLKLKNIPTDVEFIATGKYDGISMLKEESETKPKAWTKGREDSNGNTDGGLRSEKHLIYMGDVNIPVKYTFGEVIFNKTNFLKYIEENDEDIDTSSPRNIASGFFRRDDLSDDLHYLDFIRYGYFDDSKNFETKKEVLDFLNTYQKVKVPYKVFKLDEISEDFLKGLYNEFSSEYILDGLILEVNNLSIQKKLGRNRNNNPIGAIAFKSKEFDERKTTTVLGIEYNTSKGGNCIPVALLKPVILGGTEVKRCTLNNASYMKNMGIGIGSDVVILKSGSIIPLIIEVINTEDFVYPDVEGGVEWDENKVHLRTLLETDEQKIKKIYAFFNIIGVDGVSIKTFELLYNSGFKTIKDILNMSKKDFSLLERFGERKSDNVYKAIQSKTKDIPLPVLQHSTSIFKSLGRKKLILLEHFETKPTMEQIMEIEGFSEILAKNYLDGYDKFYEFIKDLPITYTKTKKVEIMSNDLEGKTFVFSGYRDKNAEEVIVSRAGKIGSSVSKTTTYLIMKEVGTGSSKEEKALSIGVTVLDKQGLEDLLK